MTWSHSKFWEHISDGGKIRVVFLDCDGVINSTLFFKGETPPSWDNLDALVDPVAVERLERLCAAHERSDEGDTVPTVVVITSLWRLEHKLIDIREALGKKGLTPWRVFGATTPNNEPGANRDDEIQGWLNKTKGDAPLYHIRSFVILDDVASNITSLKDRLVLTSGFDGFTEHDLRLAIEMLNRSWEGK